jgi:hypothetical protein
MVDPTFHGKRRWPESNGYLELNAKKQGEREKLPCTCGIGCSNPDCEGTCGCEACALAWLVYHDDHALWDDQGNMITPSEIEGPWKDIKNLQAIHARCHQSDRLD